MWYLVSRDEEIINIGHSMKDVISPEMYCERDEYYGCYSVTKSRHGELVGWLCNGHEGLKKNGFGHLVRRGKSSELKV